MEPLQTMGNQQPQPEPVALMFQFENWALLIPPENMLKRWPHVSDKLFILHTPCKKKAEKNDFGQCFPMYRSNLWQPCPFCQVQASSNVITKLWTVYEFIRPK